MQKMSYVRSFDATKSKIASPPPHARVDISRKGSADRRNDSDHPELLLRAFDPQLHRIHGFEPPCREGARLHCAMTPRKALRTAVEAVASSSTLRRSSRRSASSASTTVQQSPKENPIPNATTSSVRQRPPQQSGRKSTPSLMLLRRKSRLHRKHDAASKQNPPRRRSSKSPKRTR